MPKPAGVAGRFRNPSPARSTKVPKTPRPKAPPRVHFTIGLLPSEVIAIDNLALEQGLVSRSDTVAWLLKKFVS